MKAVYTQHVRAASGGRLKQWWRREVFHLTLDGTRTLCNRDCTEYGTINDGGEPDINNDYCCKRCAARAK